MTAIWSELAYLAGRQPSLDCTLYPIEDHTIVSIQGPDSSKFMQGQFTCHLNEISPTQYRPGACCNAKGRMVSSFNLAQLGEGHYLLGLHSSILDLTFAHLKKYMVFFKTQMQASDYVAVGVTGKDAKAALALMFSHVPESDFSQVVENGQFLITLPHGAGFQIWLPKSSASTALAPLLSKCLLSTNTLWNENLIQHGLGYVSTETSEQLIPQMMNLTQAGGVSFSKGCYTGQEIVARMQYLGKLKRHMYRLSFDAQNQLQSGDEVFIHNKPNPVGLVVNCVNTNLQQLALVVLEDKALSHLAQGELIAGPQQAIAKELLSLPYDIIDEQPE